MALSSALVDRARLQTSERLQRRLADGSIVPVKVEGTSQMERVFGPYFDCRVDWPAAPEANDASGGRERVAQHPTLIFDVFDENDDPVVLNAEQRVTVESDDFGTITYEITGEPVMYRKKVGMIVGVANLVRVVDQTIVEGRVAQVVDAERSSLTLTPSGTELTA